MWWHFSSAWWYALVAGPAAAGLALVWWALWADGRTRTPERRRCPQCWYDLRGVPGLTCPECGHVASREAELRRSRRRWGSAALGALLLAPLGVVFGVRDGRRAWYALPPEFVTAEVRRVGAFEWRTFRRRDPDAGGQYLQVRCDGKLVWELEDWLLDLSEPPRDLDGDGVPEVLVGTFTGGANCCWNFYIFSTERPPRLLAAVDAMKGWAIRESDGGPLLLVPDVAFMYWRTSGVSSPRTDVFYRLRRGRLEAVPDAIRVPTPEDTSKVLSDLAADQDTEYGPSPVMWAHMLELLYAGQPERAWAFFERAWPPGVLGKGDFLFDFAATLSLSPQWRDVQAAREATARGEGPPAALINSSAPPPEPAE